MFYNRFIGEMYNAQVLSAEVITHVCESYIRASTEHGLDSICRLLQTAGKLLEQQLQSQGQTEVSCRSCLEGWSGIGENGLA